MIRGAVARSARRIRSWLAWFAVGFAGGYVSTTVLLWLMDAIEHDDVDAVLPCAFFLVLATAWAAARRVRRWLLEGAGEGERGAEDGKAADAENGVLD